MADPNRGLAPPVLSHPVGQVRLLLGDTDATDVKDGEGEYLFYSDRQIEALLTLHGGNVKRTVVRILRTAGFAQVYLLKKFTSADVAVDGPSVSRELRLLADALQLEADADDRNGGDNSVFLVAATGGDSGYTTPRQPWDDDWGAQPQISVM